MPLLLLEQALAVWRGTVLSKWFEETEEATEEEAGAGLLGMKVKSASARSPEEAAASAEKTV